MFICREKLHHYHRNHPQRSNISNKSFSLVEILAMFPSRQIINLSRLFATIIKQFQNKGKIKYLQVGWRSNAMEHRVIMHTLILTLSYQPQRWFKWSGRTNCDLRWGGRRRRRRRGGDSPCLPSHWCHTGLIFLLLTDLYRLFWCRRQWTPPMWRDTA